MRRTEWLVCLLLGIAGLSLILAASQAEPRVFAQAAPTATPFYQINTDPDLNAAMDYVEQAVSILRDLAPRAEVTRAFLSREELLDYLVGLLDHEYPPERARDDVIFYHAFGWMDLDTDLRAIQLAVLTEQVGGFYDPDLDAMFVISENAEMDPLNQILYAHEFTHALQDQHYDLNALGLGTENSIGAPDELLAVQALVEGDAMLLTEGFENWLVRSNPVAMLNVLGEALFLQTEALFAAPPILQAELTFPYIEGRNFVYTLFMAQNGWNFDSIYADPPTTTAQILHPELYVADREAVEVTVEPLDAALSDGWRLVYDRTLGEFYLREYLRTAISQLTAGNAAAGWRGDRYRLYFNDLTQETALILRIAWDSPQDAAEFTAAYRSYGATRFGDPGVRTGPYSTCWYADETLCLWSGAHESLIALVPDQTYLAAVIATQQPVQ